MSWWTDETTGAVLGDSPADILEECLGTMIEEREQRGLGRPTMAEFLAALADALRKKTRDWCGSEEDIPFRVLAARLEVPDGSTCLDNQGQAVDEELVLRLCEAFEAVSLEYEDVLDRPPRRGELLTSVAFVLGPEPDAYLSVQEGAAVQDLVIVPMDDRSA